MYPNSKCNSLDLQIPEFLPISTLNFSKCNFSRKVDGQLANLAELQAVKHKRHVKAKFPLTRSLQLHEMWDWGEKET